MRGASKRLGGVVFYTRGGETVARELAPSVSNPRTEVQMNQRIKLSNVVEVYKANKSWMKGAFEDKAEKETDYNAFVRMNLSNSRVALSKQEAASGFSIVAPYKVSSGTLPSISCSGQTTGVASNIYTGNLMITEATTVAQFSDAIISNNNGIVEGMQLSLIVNLQQLDSSSARYFIISRTYEVILSLSNSELLSEYYPYGILQTLNTDGKPLFYNASQIGDGAATFMLSRTVSGRLYVSSQILQLYGNQSIYSIYTSNERIAAAISSYGSNEERFLDSDKAEPHNPVIVLNYIQALKYLDVLYTSGQTISISVNESNILDVFMGKQVSANAELVWQINGGGVPTSLYTTEWNADRTKLQITLLPSFMLDSLQESYLAIVDNGITSYIEFYVQPLT